METIDKDIMTVRQAMEQRYRQQGRLRGIQQGRQQEKVIIAKKLLEHNASFDLIKQTMGLSQKQIEDIAETIKPFILKLL